MDKQGTDKLVRCVGSDNKLHICEAHEHKTRCGVEVKRKKLLRNDYKLFSCYECTF
jgi:hypothetical protein